MNALLLFASTFALVLFLGLQSLNVNGGHRLLSFVTSFGIGAANFGIFASISIHPWMVRALGRRKPSTH